MSNLLKFSLLFLGLFAASFSAVAQSDKKDDGRRQGYWFLGLNSGGAWQQSDIKAAAGGGLGLYLGGNLFYRKTSPISLDLRFRYLYTATYGQDWRRTAVTGTDLLGGNYFDNSFFGNGISTSKNYTPSGGGLGFAYMNNETDFHDLSLELRLNFETLRRKYRVWFSLYAGAGVGFYNTHFDQLDARSNSIDPDLYRYENINTTGSASAIRSSIYSLRDGIYETDVTQGFNAGFMTHAGFELGYWITPRFAIGIGHRVTWTLRDDFDGFRSTARSRNDIHHYANLFLHFDLYSGRARINTNGNINNNTNINTNVVVTAPRVAFSFPNCPYSTQSAVTTIRVNITEVTSSENINLTINGTRITNFRYNSTTGVLETTIALVAGSNAIFVSATNSGGTASSSCNIVYTNQPVPVVRNPPTVNITYPSNNLTVNTNLINVFANVTNVSNISQVTYTVNGAPSRNFTLNGNSFVANNTALVVGSNTIVVSATNADGSASDTRVVIYNQPNQPPVVVKNPPTVQITNPSANPFTTNSNTVNISAITSNINNANQITFTVNGQITRNFSFSGNRITANGISLVQGNNNINIVVTNADGTASDNTTIIYRQPEPVVVQNPPTVRINNPSANPFTTNSNSINIGAITSNINNANQITFTVNGQITRNFSFNGNSIMANGINLVQGNNNINIVVTNADGTASDNTTIIYNEPRQPVVVQNPPTVQITNPVANPFTTNSNTVNISALTTNINNSNQITFTVNGQITRNFSFNGNRINANGINLVQGNNNINIVVTNADGTASDNTTIIYNEPRQPVVVQNPPTVQITNPVANPFTTNSNTVNISALTTNINNSNQITFTVNGQITRNFSFSGNRINANGINLVQGNNMVNIVVTNADGTASDNTTIIYNEPRQPVVVQNPPTVQITNPSANPFNTTNNVANITAVTTNIVRSNQITFTLNGRVVTNFTFSNGTINSPLVLQQGANNIVIRVENNDGNASDQTLINYSLPCQQPTIAVQAPANTNSNSVSIQANMTNISQVSQVRFTVNGQANSNFSLRNGNFAANVSNLQQGANSFALSATNDCGTANENFTVTYNAPAPVVVRTPPTVNITNPAANPFNTSSSTTNINATITNVNSVRDVTFTINGQASTNFSLRGTAFAATNVSLVSGNNTVVITGTNPDGTASDQTTIVYSAPCPQPTIALQSPSTNSSVNTASVDAQATFVGINNKNQVAFTVNGRKADFNFSPQGANGSFSTTVNSLQQGANTLVISVTNNCGTATQTFTVTYNAPAPVVVPTPPTVNITNPSSNPFTSSSDNVNINATITNVSSMRGVTFTVNGQANSNFSLRGTSFAAMNVSLNDGRNTVVITGTNQDGTASDQTVVIYNAPVVVPTPPTVQITSPSGNPFSSPADQTTINATITNVATSAGVTFTVNGRRNTNFSLLGTRFTANNVALQQGNNDIVITGTNPDGTASDQTVIIYKQTAPPPTVDITTPNTNPFNTSNDSENINATVTNVASANDITFLVNGQRVNNFSLRGTNFSANNVSLNAGRNTIEVRADNGVGQASDQTVIIYNQPVPPTVNITNPSSNPSNVTTDLVNIAADIRNVSSASEVTFTVNGSRISNFNLRGTGFNASNVRLQAGSNTVIITATTPAGSASDQTTIVYTAPAPQPTTPQPVISNMNALQQQVRGATNTYVTAQIANVSNASGIVFTANGQRITNFTFSNGNFRADNVPVQNGVNTYTITATNTAGSATMSAALNYSSGNTGGGNQNRTAPAPNTNPNNTNGRTIAPTEKKTGTDEEKKTEENKTDNKGGKMERKNTTPPTPPNKSGKMGGE